MAARKSANGMPRFCDTWTAAMNWPWLRKPAEAVFSVIVLGSIFSMRAPRGLPCSFCAIGFSGVVGAVVCRLVSAVVVVVGAGDVCGLPCVAVVGPLVV